MSQEQTFLAKFEDALTARDFDAVVSMFTQECYWRDLVAFTWNIKTMEGRDQVREMLASCLERANPHDWRLADGEKVTASADGFEVWITFQTDVARGYGLMRVRNGQIWTLLTTMVELKGHEEKVGFTRPLGAIHGAPGRDGRLGILYSAPRPP